MRSSYTAGLVAFTLALSLPAGAAPIPQGVVAMITAASDSGDAGALKTTIGLAKQTNPDSTSEIDALVADLAKVAAEKHVAQLESNTFFEGWTGEGQAGGSLNTGNTDARALSVGLRLQKEGLRWSHLVLANADYARQNDVASQNRASASDQNNYKLGDRWYGLALLSWERDRSAGFDRRFSEAIGAGYTAYRTQDASLGFEAGPAYRQTHFINGEQENRVGLRFATNYAWTISPDVQLTENAVYYAQTGNSTFTSNTALTAKLRGALSVQASLFYNREQRPPLGLNRVDTTTRLSLVYGF